VKQLAAYLAFSVVSLITLHGSAAEEIYLGSGVKAGEIGDTSAIIHVRLTAAPEQDDSGRIPGCEGTARLAYALDESGDNAATTQWAAATADQDYRFNDADRWQQWKAGDGGRRGGKKDAKPEKWLTHEEGIMVFKQVFPMSDPTYRTFRWGQGLQIWLVEGRDYRSPNAMPDGPAKTLWGKRQLAWLKRTLLESDADWRVLISPTPIIGPDRITKNDNHANPKGFWTEGQAFLDWIKENRLDNLILVCGDRHWQYESLDQRNGRKIYEYSCGPTCDAHTANVPPITEAHRGVTQPYSGSRGGFLTVTYQTDRTLTFEFFDQNGTSQYRRVLGSAPVAN
jgi:phosphodiesterase/alkaline phosphatase D-like protein